MILKIWRNIEMYLSLVLAWLGSLIVLSPDRLSLILDKYRDLEIALDDNFLELRKSNSKLNCKWLVNLEIPTNWRSQVEEFEKMLAKYQNKVLSIYDLEYPQKLKNLDNYPVVLYFQGDVHLLNQPNFLTVVGSRNYTRYSQTLVETILNPVCKAGVGVVSGLALGVDSLSHQVALVNLAPTIGMTGSGLADDVFYPSANLGLKNKIIGNGGLVLSEYPPLTKATVYSFPKRNRVLAGLTELTWVVQAGHKSGTLITANLARDFGKTVATTPASVFDKSFAGNLSLIKDGASIVSESLDIMQILALNTGINSLQIPLFDKKLDLIFNSPEEERVYTFLNFDQDAEIDFISANLKLDTIEITTHLTMLELSGLVANLGENRWVKMI